MNCLMFLDFDAFLLLNLRLCLSPKKKVIFSTRVQKYIILLREYYIYKEKQGIKSNFTFKKVCFYEIKRKITITLGFGVFEC